jgi:hypothetical protein
MSKHRTLSQIVDFAPNFRVPRCTAEMAGIAADAETEAGAFRAGLYYVAADLTELARTAPAGKSEPLLALVRLVQAMAEG